jgi:alpha-tubulin suppressor-like RCC1 family protein
MRQRFIASAAHAALALALAVVVAVPAVGSTSASFTASAGAAGGDVTTIELPPLAGASAVVADDGSASVSWSAPTLRAETFTGYRVERTVDGETTVLSPAVTTETFEPDDLDPELTSKHVTAVSIGDRVGCAIAEGQLYCWGSYGGPSYPANPGVGDGDPHLSPVRVGGLLAGKTVTDVSVGSGAVCAVADDSAYCWGFGPMLGASATPGSDSLVPVKVAGVLADARVTRVSVGGTSVCAIADDLAYCWGWGGSGRLGDGSTANRYLPVAVAGPLAGRIVTDISVGIAHACAVSDGEAFCWGEGDYGRLGDGGSADRTLPRAVDTAGVLAGLAVTRVAAGSAHSCAVADARAFCWGWNSSGQLGDGGSANRTTPVAVSPTGPLADGATVSEIVAEGQRSCAIADGLPACWGGNIGGALGDGTSTDRPTPVAVDDSAFGGPVTALATGDYNGCAVASGIAACWGSGSYGRLGTGSTASSTIPVPIDVSGELAKAVCAPGWRVLDDPPRCGAPFVGGEQTGFVDDLTRAGLPRAVTEVSAGVEHSCAIAGGEPVCWGGGADGRLGNGSTGDSAVPVVVNRSGVLAGTVATDVSVGTSASCAVADTKVACWGDNSTGMLGDGATAPYSAVPVAVTGGALAGAEVVQVAVGYRHACALTADGRVACWGDNSEGGLGDGTQTNRAVPAFVQGALAGKTVTQLALGSFQGCALAVGLVYCWGGYDDGVFHTQPMLVPGLSGVTQIAASGRASCALAAGELWCWGRHDYGLWRGAGYDFPLPQKVPMTGVLSGAVIADVTIGQRMACVVAGDELACWGSQVGGEAVVDWVDDGALSAAGAPERISAGYQHACAIEDGILACWYGTTSRALLGRTDVNQSTAPVAVDATGVLAGGSCAAGWVMTAAERCAPGAGIGISYRVSYTKRGWASPAVDALVTWASIGGAE